MKVFIILTILIILGGTTQKKDRESSSASLANLVLYIMAVYGIIVLVINWNILNWFY